MKKLIETLTTQQKIEMLGGTAVGIFPSMVLSNDAFYGKIADLCLGYYTARSGEKPISVTYEKILSIIEADENSTIADTAEAILGKLIRSKFIDKWERVYNALIVEQYNALKNYEFEEKKDGTNSSTRNETTVGSKTGSNTDKTTHDISMGRVGSNTDNKTYNITDKSVANNTDVTTYDIDDTKVGSNNDTVTYDTDITNDGTRGTKQTVTREATVEDGIYGFNSNSPVGDTNSSDSSTETTVGNKDDNTTHNKEIKTGTETTVISTNETISKDGTESKAIGIDATDTKTGTENTTKGINETLSKTGSDTKNITINEQSNDTINRSDNDTIDETIIRSARDGIGADLISAELTLRNEQIFFDIVYADIDSIATLQIYI